MNKMRIISSKEFKNERDNVLNRGKADLSSIASTVKTIITDVKEQGDTAILKYTEKFDKVRLTPAKLKVTDK
ncbi:histidinol dehydrogenase, partial [Candidatus Bathyarchaeota archaeon]|nr:histidinol dehydrogenase [Candidatus Bathyarchaeota archaeon]